MKIIYLVDKKILTTKMSRVRFHGINALSKLADVTYWGINWPNYDNTISVQENLDTLDETFDLAIAYKPLDLVKFKDINIPRCIRYNEMWDIDWTLKEIKESGSQLVICHHLNDCRRYQAMGIENVQFVYIGHGAEKTIFKDYKQEKTIDILFVGYVDVVHYPLRCRFVNMFWDIKDIGNGHWSLLQKSKENSIISDKYSIVFHPHPEYRHDDAFTNKYAIEYAKIINKSKIVISCTSKHKYRLGKYVEIPMCNTAIVGDVPDDGADDYSFVIKVDNSMSNKEIAEKISYYLDNEDKRLEKVKKGNEFAANNTQEHYAKKLLTNITSFLETKNNNVNTDTQKVKHRLLESKLPSGRVLKDKLNMERRNIELHNYINTFLPEMKNLPDSQKQNKYVIDLGPGPGDFLEISRNLGFKIKGYDAKLDSIKGMGMDYVNLCAIYAKEKNIPIDYCNFEETGFRGIEDDSVYIINSRGSFEQIFSKYLLGIPHYKTHISNQEWSHTDEMYYRFKTFFSNCSKKLIKNGVLHIAFNGTKCNSLHNIISKLLPDTLHIQHSKPRILRAIKI
tara:strand:+ start:693 stop:2384 length:1692 start_codon:yes stop_codon:yes gene_type:complete